MSIKVIKEAITIEEAKKIGSEFYSDMVKGAVDIEQKTIALGGEYHIDAATVLTDNGSKPENIWGFNIVFDRPREDMLEYTALINIKPALGNRDMYIGDEKIRDKIKEIVEPKIK